MLSGVFPRQWDGVCLCQPLLAGVGSLLGPTSETWGTLYHLGSCYKGDIAHPSLCLYGNPSLGPALPPHPELCNSHLQSCGLTLLWHSTGMSWSADDLLYRILQNNSSEFWFVRAALPSLPWAHTQQGRCGKMKFPRMSVGNKGRAVNIKVPGTRGQCFFSRKLPWCF